MNSPRVVCLTSLLGAPMTFQCLGLIEKAEARALSVSKMLGTADLKKGFYAIRGHFHTTKMSNKGSLSTARMAFLDFKFADWGFSDWKWLLHHLNVLAVCNQISEPFY